MKDKVIEEAKEAALEIKIVGEKLNDKVSQKIADNEMAMNSKIEKECQNVYNQLVRHFTKALTNSLSEMMKQTIEDQFNEFQQSLDQTISVYEEIPNKCQMSLLI